MPPEARQPSESATSDNRAARISPPALAQRQQPQRSRQALPLPFLNEDGSKKRCHWLENLEK